MAEVPPLSADVFCTSCGYKLAPDDRFCPECGATRPTQAPTSSFGLTPPPPPPPPGYPPASTFGGSSAPVLSGTMGLQMAPATEPGTLQFDVAYPEHLSRLLIFVKWLLVIPHLIVLAVLLVVLSLTTIGAFFAILITGRYPYSLWTFAFGVMRWMANVTAYATDLQRDEYPPFSMDAGAYPGVRFEMEYPPRLSRGLVLIKWWLLMIPSALVLYVLQAILGVVHLLVFLAILFTGRFPRGLFDFTTGVARWNYRLGAYILLLTDKYPPFSLD